MTDVSVTASSVIAGKGAKTEMCVAGATITAGKVVYYDPTTGKCGLSDSDSATAIVRTVKGIALNGASNGQPLSVLTAGPVTIGGTLVAGSTYYLSETAGGIQPAADLGTGEYPTLLGMATSTSVLNVNIQSVNVAL